MNRPECKGILGTKSYGIMPEELEQAGIDFSVVSNLQYKAKYKLYMSALLEIFDIQTEI